MTTVVTRAGKGSALTYAEMDANFTNLNADKAETANPTFTGYIQGDFSNVAIANRLLFQTNEANAPTNVGIIPNGTAVSAGVSAFGGSDPANSSYVLLAVSNTGDADLIVGKAGTGVYQPLAVSVGGTERLRIDQTTGNVLATSGALGYGAGSGGTVTQPTSKNTNVTLHKPCGQITTAPDSLAPGAYGLFILYSSLIDTGDQLLVNADNTNSYRVECVYSASGGAGIKLTNITGGALAEAVLINFAVFKGATS